MHFKFAVNLISTSSYVTDMCTAMRTFAVNQVICFRIYLCFIFLSMTPFVRYFVPSCKVNEDIVCLSACVSLLFIGLSLLV